MGETQHTLFPLDFNRSIVIEDRPEQLTADAGGPALRRPRRIVRPSPGALHIGSPPPGQAYVPAFTRA